MPMMPVKITQLSKDFDMKSKDVLDTLKDYGLEKKTGGSIDGDEFEIFMQKLTLANQIKDIDSYREGRTKLSASDKKSKKSDEEKKTAAPVKEEKLAVKEEKTAAPDRKSVV